METIKIIVIFYNNLILEYKRPMAFLYSNIDIIIFICFLVVNLLIGITPGKKRSINTYTAVQSMKEYAIGRRNFPTANIAATAIVIWISGSVFLTNIFQVYTNGLFYIVPAVAGTVINGLIVCFVVAPRVEGFLGNFSVAETMGNLYGEKVRLITAIASICYCIAKVSIQFHIASVILQLFSNFSGFYATLSIAVVVIAYSSVGGIRAITFSDTVQFFTFCVIVPILGIAIWQNFDSEAIVYNTVLQSPLFDLTQLANIHNPRFWPFISSFIFFIVPSLNPAVFQKILMAKDTGQVTKSFGIASIACFLLLIMFIWIAILIFCNNPNLQLNDMIPHMMSCMDDYHIGLKGMLAVCIMSMLISTVNSYINVAAIIASYDLPKALGIKWSLKQTLTFSYVNTILIGIIAFIISLYIKNLLFTSLLKTSFYMPIVSGPLILSIFGFRSTPKCIIIGMVAGLFMILFWHFSDMSQFYAAIVGLFTNLLFLLGSHYLLKQPGGFSSGKKLLYLTSLTAKRKRKIINFFNNIKNFNILKLCHNSLPRQESTYIYLGLFIMLSTHFSIYIVPEGITHRYQEYIYLYNLINYTALITAASLLIYPLWSQKYNNKDFISILWLFCIFYTLIFSNSVLIIINNYNKLQIVVFMVNLIIVAILLRWYLTMILIVINIFISSEFYKYYMQVDNLPSNEFIQFKIISYLILFAIILILFLRPKQKQQELADAKNIHLGRQIRDREEELQKLLNLKHEFLRNINHEIHTPMTGITSLGETLWEKYDKLSDKQRRQAALVIAKSSRRLNSLMNNLLDFSKLTSLTYNLNKEEVNFSNLVHERINICSELYLNDRELEFVLNIPENITVNCDKYYIKQTLDNLIINAITYGNKGKILINLIKTALEVKFTIQDEGIGVPKEELLDIFGVFMVSSKTRTPAGGRGMGLALCKKVIEVHMGKIWAENDQNGKTIFIATLPL